MKSQHNLVYISDGKYTSKEWVMHYCRKCFSTKQCHKNNVILGIQVMGPNPDLRVASTRQFATK